MIAPIRSSEVDDDGEEAYFAFESVEWRPHCAKEAFERYAIGNIDFADCLIEVAGERPGVQKIYTFDRKAAHRPMFTQLIIQN